MIRLYYLVGAIAFFATASLSAQTDGASKRFDKITDKIHLITVEERAALKKEIDAVNQRAANGEITWEQADAEKVKLAEVRSENIERRTQAAQQELKKLVADIVDTKIENVDIQQTHEVVEVVQGGEVVEVIEVAEDTQGSNSRIVISTKTTDSTKVNRNESRTTSQFVAAFGMNFYLQDGDFQSDVYENSFKSRFFEWGVTWRTRLSENSGIANIKYGLSLQYNQMTPKNSRGVFVTDGDQTYIEPLDYKLDKTLLRNVNAVIPVHFELDFTKKYVTNTDSYIRSHNGFRLGLGGYAGVNVRSKMKLKFEDETGNKVKSSTTSDYNAEKFVYGLSGYIGYGTMSLYAKYDLNEVFENNPIAENNLSIGLRFDWN